MYFKYISSEALADYANGLIKTNLAFTARDFDGCPHEAVIISENIAIQKIDGQSVGLAGDVLDISEGEVFPFSEMSNRFRDIK